jgi:hypothetical protein
MDAILQTVISQAEGLLFPPNPNPREDFNASYAGAKGYHLWRCHRVDGIDNAREISPSG